MDVSLSIIVAICVKLIVCCLILHNVDMKKCAPFEFDIAIVTNIASVNG